MIWRPSTRRIAQTNLDRFMAGHRDYDALWRWSIENRDDFWTAIWRFCGVKASQPYTAVTQPAEGVRQVTWFPGARLNFAENLLRYDDDAPAILAWNESGQRRAFTQHELRQYVSRVAQALRASGVGPGDRVAAWLPNIPETVIAMLATASLGAVWCSCSPDFGVQGVLDRFQQIEPKVLIAADGVHYNGKRLDTLGRLAEIVRGLPTLRLTIVVTLDDPHPNLSAIPHAIRWQDEIAFYPPKPLVFEQLPFEHPLYILFSSGTTGLPKCMVHGAGGTLLQHLKEHVLHTDVKPNDRVFYHTTCGWMMWNWLVSALATGACIVLYDGSPVFPKLDILWDMASASRVTIFGTSAKYLMMMQKAGLSPRSSHDLASLRTLLSTGSPLPFESWEYIYSHVHPDIQVSSISGGTDIVSCFALGNPVGPVYRGEIQVRGLGMHVEVFNEQGQPVVGEKGELVCHPPFPSMPLRFWNDPGEEKYRAAYFERFPGVWRHGDWAEITPRGGVIIHGRSDTTLNPGGVRIGTAEIYRQVQQVDEVLESLVIGRPVGHDVEIVLFVKLRPGVELTPEFRNRLCSRIRQGASPHHVPRHIFAVSDLPRTVSGKLSEVAVRDMVQGRPLTNTSALANPECLEQFLSLPFSGKP